MNYVNYHKHSYFSNVLISDSTVSPDDYAKRAIELGQTVLSSCEHSYPGRYIESYELAKQYNLKFLFAVETYFVKDRFEKDRTNAHMVLLAKNENGRKAINRILSESNLTGFYYRARIDLELLLSLPSDDVWITTACLAGIWQYEDYEELILKISKHFKNNFFLEVQYHDTESQINLNKRIINLSNKHNISIIFGTDSHYIYPEQAQERDDYLSSKNISYEDEEGWYLDYPSCEEVIKRFQEQDVLNKYQIEEAINNTNILNDVEVYDSIVFNSNIKLPSLYLHLTQEDKNKMLSDLIWQKWDEEKNNIASDNWKTYEEEIKKELSVIIETGMADYFLLDYEIIKKGKEMGGHLTQTGRGSGPSFYTARLLDFTTIDRIASTVKLFPERFITKERILETGSLPDFDFNIGNPEIFANAQIEVMGEDHSYPMIAYGTLRPKAAWKLYARAKNIEFETANQLSEKIGEYEKKLIYAEDEDKEYIDVIDFIGKEYIDEYNESTKYLGVVAQAGVHPCFSKGTKIFTSKGYKNIENIVKNDMVLTHKGNYKKVLQTMSSFSKDIYNIKVGGQIFKVTGNHPVYAMKTHYEYSSNIQKDERVFDNPEWVSIKEIFENKNKNGYQTSYKIGSPINHRSRIIEYENLDTHNKDFWWLVGKYLADGWLFKRKGKSDYRIIIALEKKQEEVDEIEYKIKNLYSSHISEERTVLKLYINNKELFLFLQQFGKYSYGKFIPNFVLDLPIDLLKNFLEGYLSSDGHFNGKTYVFSTTSNNLALGIQSCVHKAFNKNCTIKKVRDYRKGIIEGRIVNCRPQWLGIISYSSEKGKQWCDDNYAWYNIDFIKKYQENKKIQVFNIEVKEDNSYTCGNLAVHNCAYLILNQNIKEEIGLIRIKDNICCLMDGDWAERYSFLKNDLLKVNVVELIHRVYERIGVEPHPFSELIKICKDDKKVWEVYANAWTTGINQVEPTTTAGRVAKYKPKNISEISAFVAAIRPGFKSNYKQFESREQFSYGIPSLDSIIQTKEFPQSYLLYQENAMQVLAYAGIPMNETYNIIKNIAKKRYDKILKYKDIFLSGMTEKIIVLENKTRKEAKKIANMTWQIVEDSTRYSFNSSHAYSVAGDSLYGVYLKSHYPVEFYEVLMNILEESGDKNRLSNVIAEAERAYGIKFPKFQFGQDNRYIKGNPQTKEITASLKTIKGFNDKIGSDLYELGQNKYDSFIDFLIDAEEKNYISKRYENLIKIGYFNIFGGNEKIMNIFLEFTEGKNRYSNKHTDKTKNLRIVALKEFEKSLEDKKYPIMAQIIYDQEILGYINTVYPEIDKRYIFVQSIDTRFAPRIESYCLSNGKTVSLKIYKKMYENNIILGGDILFCRNFEKKAPIKYDNGEYLEDLSAPSQYWLTDYDVIQPEDFDKNLNALDK